MARLDASRSLSWRPAANGENLPFWRFILRVRSGKQNPACGLFRTLLDADTDNRFAEWLKP